MLKKSFRLLLILLFGLFASLTFAELLKAQSTTPRDSLIQAIQDRAVRDVNLGKTPASLSDLEKLFGEEAVRTRLSMSEVLDIYETAYSSAAQDKPWWTRLTPDTGWMLAAFLFVLFILRDIIKENLTKFIQWILTIAYNRLAGYRLFWQIALNRYRKALVERYQKLNIPFRPGKPLDMKEVYVPLKAAETGDTELIDAYQAISKYQRLMVVGAPGSGKSMLLRHIALTYARDEHSNRTIPFIPILIELNRLNDSSIPLQEHLVETLAQNQFPEAKNFIKARLKDGSLLLLFDGLDEVNSTARERVVNQINDLIMKHSVCRAVITCRTAVYKEEFGDSTDQKLEIVEFSDQQIQCFLSSWEPDLPPDKSIEHLLRNLSERPRIMALARNPLLLTIIAYLYTDTEFVLPHSRAEFYSKSVNVLLEQWKEKRNKYKLAQKQLILQHLALFNQDSIQLDKYDRRSIDLSSALAEIKTVLPTLTLSDDDAQPILDEIVERSGLLISIDGGLKYQFAHLTLQEFFAAKELEDQSYELIMRFKANPEAWRETVKLWCGLLHDSTRVIADIYAEDDITAFECLGDAQKIDANLVNRIVTDFKTRLGEKGETGDAVVRAFATVATDPSIRGKKVFDFLAATIEDVIINKRRLAAANALALTNLPRASEILAQQAPKHPEIQAFVAQMGDLAVPILSKLAGKGQIWAIEALQTIGTLRAAQVLTPLLWDKNEILQYHAAWRMATLLSKSKIEASLRDYPLTSKQRCADHYYWIWEPFTTSTNLRIITGRIAYLLHTSPSDTIPATASPTLDVRLVIPLCTIAAQDGKLQALDETHKNIQSEFEEKFNSLNTIDFSVDPGWHYLFNSLESSIQKALKRCLFLKKPKPTRNDWRDVTRHVEYKFETSEQSKGIKLMVTIFYLLSLLEIGRIIIISPRFFSWRNCIEGMVGLFLVWILLTLGKKKLSLDYAVRHSLITSLFLGAILAQMFSTIGAGTIGLAISSVISGVSISAIISISYGNLNSEVIERIAIGSWLGICAGVFSTLIVFIIFSIFGGRNINLLSGAIGGTIGGVVFNVLIDTSKTSVAVVAIIIAIAAATVGLNEDLIVGIVCGIIGSLSIGMIVGVMGGFRYGRITDKIVVISISLVVGATVGSSVTAIVYHSLYLPTILFNLVRGIGVVAFCLMLLLTNVVLVWYGAHRERQAQNPLKELLERSLAATSVGVKIKSSLNSSFSEELKKLLRPDIF